MTLKKFFSPRLHLKSDAPNEQKLHIIIAPDKFKGTLTANEAADIMANALGAAFPEACLHICPMADGGEGTAEIIAKKLDMHKAVAKCHDALGKECEITYYEADKTCAVDSAEIVGLTKLLKSGAALNPWQTSTYGIGEFILQSLKKGIEQIYIGIGGTATIDGGIGMLGAMGARFYDVEGTEITERPLRARHLSMVYSADLSNVKRLLLQKAIIALADVDTPLLPHNDNELSSLSFAPQKGLDNDEIPLLAEALRNFRNTIDASLHSPANEPHYQGAGGGIGYALHRILRCPCCPGAQHIATIYHIPSLIKEHKSIAITGEGCFDNQSTQGKVVGTLINLAEANNADTIVVCGKCTISSSSASKIPTKIIETSLHTSSDTPLTHESAKIAMENSMPNLISAIKQVLTD